MSCAYDPEALRGLPLGMFHCPLCGEMVVAGCPHPDYDVEGGPVSEEVRKFPDGARVRVVGQSTCCHLAPVGQGGTVKGWTPTWEGGCSAYAVEMDGQFPAGHMCNGLTKDRHGQWIGERDLEWIGGTPVEPTKRHGHPRFYEITAEEQELHDKKNHDYAAGGDPLGNFKRVSQFFAMYPGLKLSDPAVVAIAYAMKQVDAYLWLKSNGHRAKVEGYGARLQDISVYAKITRIIEEEQAPAGATCHLKS